MGVEEIQGKRRTELKLLIHQSQAGCIIGKGGQKIKELREVDSDLFDFLLKP